MDEFFLTVLITPPGNTALQGRTKFGDYKPYIRLAHPAWIDMGFFCLALRMQQKYLTQLHIKLENFAGKNFYSACSEEKLRHEFSVCKLGSSACSNKNKAKEVQTV